MPLHDTRTWLGSDVVSCQAALLAREISAHLARGQPYALLSFPDHSNVGDSAIWLGNVAALQHITGRRASYTCAQEIDLDELRRELSPDNPVFIHGGGNLGDVWPEHQLFRETVLDGLADYRVIQLPQTVHFRDAKAADRFARRVEHHGNFHLMVRDRTSLDYASRAIPAPVRLVPDAAFFLGQLSRVAVPERHDTLYLLRTDIERGPIEIETVRSRAPGPIADWLDEPPGLRVRTRPQAAMAGALSFGFSRQAMRERLYWHMANRRVDRGRALLSSAERIVSDRLHVHILSVLMNIPHVSIDNNYGKIHAYIRDWTSDCPLVQTATTAESAIAGLAALPRRDEWPVEQASQAL